MSTKIKIGIIGVGQIGKAHIKRYAEIPDAEIVAIADINDEEAQHVASQYNIPNTYHNYRELISRDDILAVDVCLHNNFHRSVTIHAMEAGKHVYCEKPIAGSYIDAEEMVKASEKLGRKLYIQLSTLFSIETKAARTMIEQGMLGKIYHARSTGFRRRGRPYVDGYGTAQFVQKHVSAGGALYDMGVYHLSAMLYLIGNPKPERITGKTYQELVMDENRKMQSGYNVEELGVGFVKFSDGLTMDIIEAWAINFNKFEGSCVFGSSGGIRLDPFGYYFSQGDLDFDSEVDLGGFNWRLHSLRANADAYDSAEKHWIAALQERVPLIPAAELALNTMLISEGIYLSDRLGKEVSAEEVRSMSEPSFHEV